VHQNHVADDIAIRLFVFVAADAQQKIVHRVGEVEQLQGRL